MGHFVLALRNNQVEIAIGCASHEEKNEARFIRSTNGEKEFVICLPHDIVLKKKGEPDKDYRLSEILPSIVGQFDLQAINNVDNLIDHFLNYLSIALGFEGQYERTQQPIIKSPIGKFLLYQAGQNSGKFEICIGFAFVNKSDRLFDTLTNQLAISRCVLSCKKPRWFSFFLSQQKESVKVRVGRESTDFLSEVYEEYDPAEYLQSMQGKNIVWKILEPIKSASNQEVANAHDSGKQKLLDSTNDFFTSILSTADAPESQSPQTDGIVEEYIRKLTSYRDTRQNLPLYTGWRLGFSRAEKVGATH